MPAAPSCDILRSLRASGSVMRHFEAPACQRRRHAAFLGACVPAGPSCDILGSLRASGAARATGWTRGGVRIRSGLHGAPAA